MADVPLRRIERFAVRLAELANEDPRGKWLQNQFLRLQHQIRKTVIFVTHDIDEALKMGDRIAVMKEGGKLAQYATPDELLESPADEFVEDFVGADRALKRLALLRAADAELRPVDDGLPFALVCDDAGRPVAWA